MVNMLSTSGEEEVSVLSERGRLSIHILSLNHHANDESYIFSLARFSTNFIYFHMLIDTADAFDLFGCQCLVNVLLVELLGNCFIQHLKSIRWAADDIQTIIRIN